MDKIVLKSLQPSVVNENEGVWVDSIDIPGLRLKVRSLENPAYVKASTFGVQDLVARYPGKEGIPTDKLAALRGQLLAEHILVGWEGLDEEYSHENALKTLQNHGYRKLCDAIEREALELAKLDVQFVEDAVKN